MIEIKTERLVLLSEIEIKKNFLVLYEDKDIDIMSIKPATGRETGFVAYLGNNPSEMVCHVCFTTKRNRIEISYGTEEIHRKKGYMYEAIFAVLKWFFENTSYEMIWAVINNNPISLKLALKVGFTKIEDETFEFCWYVLKKKQFLEMLL